MEAITDRQQDVLLYILGHIRTEGYSPTCEKVSEHFGWASPNAASEHMVKLAGKGYLIKTPRGYLPA